LASAYIHPVSVWLIGIHQKLDSVQIECAMANRCTNSNALFPSRGKKFDLNLGSHGNIRDSKQAHSDIAEIDAESIHAGRSGDYLHGGVQQLALPASPVWGVSFENHQAVQ
jgi:hypothetical protein